VIALKPRQRLSDEKRTVLLRKGGPISTRLVLSNQVWETGDMSEKRSKADKAQRQADQLEKKARHPAAKKKTKRKGC